MAGKLCWSLSHAHIYRQYVPALVLVPGFICSPFASMIHTAGRGHSLLLEQNAEQDRLKDNPKLVVPNSRVVFAIMAPKILKRKATEPADSPPAKKRARQGWQEFMQTHITWYKTQGKQGTCENPFFCVTNGG